MSRHALTATLAVALSVAGCRPPERAALELDLEAWQAWRSERIANLTAEDGWLSLIGLYWLARGQPSAFGTAPENAIVLPMLPALEGKPATLGTLLWDDDRITLMAALPGVLAVGGVPVGTDPLELQPDTASEPSLLQVGTVELEILERAGELAVRARDRASERRSLLVEIPAFAPSSKYLLDARFVPSEEGATLKIANIVGQTYDEANPGSVVFELDGRELRLEALATATDGRYFLLVGDQTNGAETYGGGRYLYVERRADGGIDLDLNRLYNPPCVFTQFATCPLPPLANRLPVRVESGEKLWEGDLAHAPGP